MPALISQKLSGYEISHRDISLNALVLWYTPREKHLQMQVLFSVKFRVKCTSCVKYACGV